MNQSILFFSNLPFSTLKNINLSVFETIIIYCVVLSGFGAVVYRNKKLLTLSVASCLIAGASFVIDQQIYRKQQSLIVYAIAKTSAIDFFNGQTCYSFSSPVNKKDSAQILYQTNGNRIRSGIGRIVQRNLYHDSVYSTKAEFRKDSAVPINKGYWKDDSFYLFGKYRLSIHQGKWKSKIIPLTPLTTDYLLLTGNPYPDLTQALKRFHFRHLIVDGSNSITNALKWQQLCRDAGILCHNTAVDGAFILKLKD